MILLTSPGWQTRKSPTLLIDSPAGFELQPAPGFCNRFSGIVIAGSVKGRESHPRGVNLLLPIIASVGF